METVSPPPGRDSEFAIANCIMSQYMLGPLEDLSAYGSMTSPDSSTSRTSTQQDLYLTDDSDFELERDSLVQPFKEQVDELLAILRVFRSFITPSSPGAGRVVIAISLFSLLQERIGAAGTLSGGFLEALPPDSALKSMWEAQLVLSSKDTDFSLSPFAATPGLLFLHFFLWLVDCFLGIVVNSEVGFVAFFFEIINLVASCVRLLYQFVICLVSLVMCFVYFPLMAITLLCAYLVGLLGFILSPFRTKDEKTLQEKYRASLHRL